MLRPIDQFIVDGFRDDPDSMAVVEQLLQNYFDKYMATEMDRVRSDIYKQQADFLKQPTGFLYAMADASHAAHFDDRLTRETLLGGYKDLFKSPEDMVLFCKRQLRLDLGLREDITLLTQAWRHSALIRIGQKEYDKLSHRLGQDLATAYIDYRLNEMIIKKMVKEQAPTSTVDYVFRKACEGSLFGIAQSLNKTPMQARIEEEGEQMLAPGQGARATARALSFAMDAPVTGALTCWGSLIGVGALEVGLELAQPILISHMQGQTQQSTVEQILSHSMFHSDEDEFAKMRSQKLSFISKNNVINTLGPKMHNSPYAFNHSGSTQKCFGKFNDKTTSETSQGSVFTQSPYSAGSSRNGVSDSVFAVNTPTSSTTPAKSSPSTPSSITKSNSPTTPKPKYSTSNPSSSSPSSPSKTPTSSSNTPSQTAPLSNHSTSPKTKSTSSTETQNSSPKSAAECQGKDKTKEKSNADKNTTSSSKSANADGGYEQNEPHNSVSQIENHSSSSTSTSSIDSENATQTQIKPLFEDEDRQMASQWAPLIGQFGLNDLKSVGANLGLILATLPDMLFGVFSRHDDNPEYSWGKNLIPIASLLLGFKFNNPLLKMLLVGYGGVGLIKNSMENIGSNDLNNQPSQTSEQQQVQFVPYTEQPLNPRIQNLQINNNILVMDIDKVPYSVTLPHAVVMAHQSKSLPLSTLANAVLQKYDEAVAAMAQNNQNEISKGIHRYNTEMDMRSSEHEAVTLK